MPHKPGTGYYQREETQEKVMQTPAPPPAVVQDAWTRYELTNEDVAVAGDALLASKYNDRSDAEKTALMHFVFSFIRSKYGLLHKLRTQDVQAATDAFEARERAVSDAKKHFAETVVAPLAPKQHQAAEIKRTAEQKSKTGKELQKDLGLITEIGPDGRKHFRQVEDVAQREALPVSFTRESLTALGKNPDQFRALVQKYGSAAINERLNSKS